MATTNFVNSSTLSDADWFNDVDALTYEGLLLANVKLGAFYISRAGTAAGFSLDASNNATLSGTLTVSGGLAYLNDTSNANMTLGLTINQGANDNEILTLKSSDVAHGITSATETDSFGILLKNSATAGGVALWGLSSGNLALLLRGTVTTEDATRSTAAVASVSIEGSVKSGTAGAAQSADQNLVVIRNLGITRFIFDSDGDSHQDVGTAWTNFDAHDDLMVMDALALTLNRKDALRPMFVKSFEDARDVLSRIPGKPIVTFNEDGHHFANMSRVTMLHHGAIRQLGERQKALEAKLLRLESRP